MNTNKFRNSCGKKVSYTHEKRRGLTNISDVSPSLQLRRIQKYRNNLKRYRPIKQANKQNDNK